MMELKQAKGQEGVIRVKELALHRLTRLSELIPEPKRQ
jgi:hypothetical protein